MQAAIESTFANGVPHLSAIAEAVAELTRHATFTGTTHGKLVRSKWNVRRKKSNVEQLAALIRTQGLLQNLIGYRQLVDGTVTGIIEIVAGGRRLEAIGQLIGEGHLPDDFAIPVLIVTEDEGIEISLTENLAREDMHPADVYAAMQAMIDRGRAIEDIALNFNLEVLTVRRYLKLANVAPRFLDMYREGQLNFEHMMAFALVDDHATQEQAWDSLGKGCRSHHDLRHLLTKQKINTQEDRVAKFVGVAAFEKAGGFVERDLFSKDGTGYISDAALLEKLAMDKLEKQRAKLLKDGAAWVDILPRADRSDLSAFGRVRTVTGSLSEEDQKKAEELAQGMENLMNRIDDADEAGDEELADVLYAQHEELEQQHNAILGTRTKVPHPEDEALAGTVLYIDYDGTVATLDKAIRPADLAKRSSDETDVAGFTRARRVKTDHSDRLILDLTSHRTVALQAEMMAQSGVALAYLTYTLVKSALLEVGGYQRGTLAKISMSRAALADAAKKGEAAAAFAQRREQLRSALEGIDADEGLLDWLLAQPQAAVLELLAFCVATSLDATLNREAASPDFVALAKALHLDMNKWWRATSESYFGSVSKDCMVKVVTEAVSAEAAVPLEKMKKAQAAEAAERVVLDARWLPEPLRVA